MPRVETRFGGTVAVGTAYVTLATIGAGTTANLLLNVANRTTGGAAIRVYVAGSAYSSGEPTGAGTVVAAIAYDMTVPANDPPIQISGIVMNAGEKLVVRSDTASSLDVIAAGVAIS